MHAEWTSILDCRSCSIQKILRKSRVFMCRNFLVWGRRPKPQTMFFPHSISLAWTARWSASKFFVKQGWAWGKVQILYSVGGWWQGRAYQNSRGGCSWDCCRLGIAGRLSCSSKYLRSSRKHGWAWSGRLCCLGVVRKYDGGAIDQGLIPQIICPDSDINPRLSFLSVNLKSSAKSLVVVNVCNER